MSSVFTFMGVQMQFFLRGILAWDLTGRSDALGLVFFVLGISLLPWEASPATVCLVAPSCSSAKLDL